MGEWWVLGVFVGAWAVVSLGMMMSVFVVSGRESRREDGDMPPGMAALPVALPEVVPAEALAEMSLEELRWVKGEWFRLACEGGKVQLVRELVYYLSDGMNGGHPRTVEREVDGRRVTLTVTRAFGPVRVVVNGRVVFDSDPGVELFVPGGWELALEWLYEEVRALREADERTRSAEMERRMLLEELVGEE